MRTRSLAMIVLVLALLGAAFSGLTSTGAAPVSYRAGLLGAGLEDVRITATFTPARPTATYTRPVPTATNTMLPRPSATSTRPADPTATLTATPRPSATPTERPRDTVTPAPTAKHPVTDLYPFQLEITQGIQDFAHSVPMVRNRRTFVRAYSKIVSGWCDHGILGEFKLIADGYESIWLKADNYGVGKIVMDSVYQTARRYSKDASHYIEVPSQALAGDGFTVHFRINSDHHMPESDYDNNQINRATGSFVHGPPLKVKFYNVQYQADGEWYAATIDHVLEAVSWIESLYPVPAADWQLSKLVWRYPHPPGAESNDCLRVNWDLAVAHLLDGQPAGRQYQGLVTAEGSYMNACAAGAGWNVASGPVGNDTYGGSSLLVMAFTALRRARIGESSTS